MTITTRLMAIALALASASALATSPSADDAWEQLTRTQVKADLAAAIASGTLTPPGEGGQRMEPTIASTVSRADVRAELARARADGTLPGSGEASVTATEPRFGEERTRDEVLAETREWRRNRSPRPEWHQN